MLKEEIFLNGTVNIIVCDGFTGNIILKFGESFIEILKIRIKIYADQGIINKIKALITKGVFKEVTKRYGLSISWRSSFLGVKWY